METWKILLISLASALVLGCGGGVLIGKYLVKRAKSDKKPLLSRKERFIYSACMLLGTAFILFGVLYKPPVTENPGFNQNTIITDDGGGANAFQSGGGVVRAAPSFQEGVVVLA